MEEWRVEISNKAWKHIIKFEKKIQIELIETLRMLKFFPFPRNLDIKKIKGTRNVFRIRKGKIRILYLVDEKRRIVEILDIDVRGRIY